MPCVFTLSFMVLIPRTLISIPPLLQPRLSISEGLIYCFPVCGEEVIFLAFEKCPTPPAVLRVGLAVRLFVLNVLPILKRDRPLDRLSQAFQSVLSIHVEQLFLPFQQFDSVIQQIYLLEPASIDPKPLGAVR